MKKKLIFRIGTIAVAIVTLISAIYIIVNHLGLVDSLDFGAGAYYYADIPNFEDYNPVFKTIVPRWVHIVLFLIWGGLMFWLWTWVDNNKSKNVNKQ